MSNKFKVGDKVATKLYGHTGTITRKNDCGNSWYVYWQTGGDVGEELWIEEHKIDLVEEKHALLQQAMQEGDVAAISESSGEPTNKITSTGGSSDYYKLIINGNHVETEDVIYAMVGGDFALGNALKALRRMYLDSEGKGKVGIDMQYDANKVKYFVDSFVKRFGGSK